MKRIFVYLISSLILCDVMAQQSFESNSIQYCTYQAQNNSLDCQSELKMFTILLDEPNLVFSITTDDVIEHYRILGKEYDLTHHSWLYKILGDDGEIKEMEHLELGWKFVIRPVNMFDGSSTRTYNYR